MCACISVDGNEDLKFWVSHLIILLATVLGVYLAASAGLKSAVQFELIKVRPRQLLHALSSAGRTQ
jgi:hypothetical protein